MNKLKILALVVSAGLILSGCGKSSSPTATPAPTPKPRKVDKNVNVEPVENRPYVRLEPREDGKAVTLTIVEVKKAAEDAEYEIEYNAGSLVQGAFGAIDSLKTLPIKKEILLGSCSTGGKCTYNTDVTGGDLTLRFGNPDYTLKSEWSFTEGATKLKTLSSRDAKFTLDISKAKSTTSTVIIHLAPGYPGTLTGKVIAGPYLVAPFEKISGSVTASIRLPLDATDGKLMAWDGKAWKDWASSTKDKVVTGTGAMSEAFVVVAK